MPGDDCRSVTTLLALKRFCAKATLIMPQVAHNHLVANFIFFCCIQNQSFNFQTYPQIVRHYRCSHSFVYAQAFPTLVQAPCSTSTVKSGSPGHVLAGLSPCEPCDSSRVSYVNEGVVQHIFPGTQAVGTHQSMLHWKKQSNSPDDTRDETVCPH